MRGAAIRSDEPGIRDTPGKAGVAPMAQPWIRSGPALLASMLRPLPSTNPVIDRG